MSFQAFNQGASSFGVGNFQGGTVKDHAILAGKYIQNEYANQISVENVYIIQDISLLLELAIDAQKKIFNVGLMKH